MNLTNNIFSQLKYHQILQFVQLESLALKDKKKSITTKKRLQRLSKLADARAALVEKIKEMDRNDPGFYPVGTQVEYRKVVPYQKIFEGVVVGHANGKILVDFIGVQDTAEMDPKYLKLMHVRPKYT